jgi:hypothetical protein
MAVICPKVTNTAIPRAIVRDWLKLPKIAIKIVNSTE